MNVASGNRIREEIHYLEKQLADARTRLVTNVDSADSANDGAAAVNGNASPLPSLLSPVTDRTEVSLNTNHHALLLLSDSALPLGSFAFSSGLESYLAHHKFVGKGTTPIALFYQFLQLSVTSLAGSTVPYILAAYRSPGSILCLDNDLDASTPCTVARRASIAQGRALLSVWERALRSAGSRSCEEASQSLVSLGSTLKTPSHQSSGLGPNGHFAPIWALVCRAMDMSLEEAVYVFLFNHAKAVLSAAVRASVMGPYQAQGVLAGRLLQEEIRGAVRTNWFVSVEDAGQVVPALDLWIGRHELLYSRIFNS
ncbi:hypothetical protein MMC19_000529 [Ptychographa xylographoides]|nr:hypothetical protein [Ptychographa xylographoides]